MLRVARLWRFPIKSVGGEPLDSAAVDDFGIEGDRGWGLVDDLTGNVLTARREPKLLMATAKIVAGEPITTTSDGHELRTDAQYSEWLERPVTLRRAGDEGGTYENPLDWENDTDWASWQGPAGAWHDSGQSRVSLVSTVSLRGWDERRFRANVTLDGAGEATLVDCRIGAGTVQLDITKQLTRCVMVTRAQIGLERDIGVLRTINSDLDARLCIGATVAKSGRIAVGDSIEIIRK